VGFFVSKFSKSVNQLFSINSKCNASAIVTIQHLISYQTNSVQ